MKKLVEKAQSMGYYDFDDHFWSPQEVCTQAPSKVNQEPFLRVPKLLETIFRKVFFRFDNV
jgi:hypothetical protein